MKKKIEDYLHFYLGCEVETNIPGQVVGTFGNINLNSWGMGIEECSYILSQLKYNSEGDYYCKPVLRPLSSLTDSEALECGKGVLDLYPTKKGNDENGGLWHRTTFHPSQFIWLLDNHFDIFNLIEAGLAIDKTKLKL